MMPSASMLMSYPLLISKTIAKSLRTLAHKCLMKYLTPMMIATPVGTGDCTPYHNGCTRRPSNSGGCVGIACHSWDTRTNNEAGDERDESSRVAYFPRAVNGGVLLPDSS